MSFSPGLLGANVFADFEQLRPRDRLVRIVTIDLWRFVFSVKEKIKEKLYCHATLRMYTRIFSIFMTQRVEFQVNLQNGRRILSAKSALGIFRENARDRRSKRAELITTFIISPACVVIIVDVSGKNELILVRFVSFSSYGARGNSGSSGLRLPRT